MAAVLACGPRALLSHQSAAALWGIRPTARAFIDVTSPGHARGPHRVAVHRARRLHPEDCAQRSGIPATSLARTLLDLAEVLPARSVERAFEEAERRELLDIGALEQLWLRSRMVCACWARSSARRALPHRLRARIWSFASSTCAARRACQRRPSMPWWPGWRWTLCGGSPSS